MVDEKDDGKPVIYECFFKNNGLDVSNSSSDTFGSQPNY